MTKENPQIRQEPWHLNRSFTVSNLLAVIATIVGGILAFNTLEHTVKANAKDLKDFGTTQGEAHKVINDRADRRQKIVEGNTLNIQELKTQTSVIKSNQARQIQDMQEVKQDLKLIIREIRK